MGKYRIFSSTKKKLDQVDNTGIQPVSSINPIEALEPWETVVRSDANSVVELLSRPGGVIDINEQNRLFVAIIRDKLHCKVKNPKDVVLLVAKDPAAHKVMLLTEQLIRQAGYRNVKSYRVSHAFLGEQYEGYANHKFDDADRLADDKKWIKERVANIIKDAVDYGASDIHCTLRSQFGVRLRVDGDMESYGRLMAHAEGEAFIRAFFKLYIAPNHPHDFSETERVSQSTVIQVLINGSNRSVRLRYEQAPGAPLGDNKLSMDVVLRIISDGSAIRIPDFDALGFDAHSNLLLNRLSRKDRGILLIVGGTGSGKSTTLDSFYQASLTNSRAAKKVLVIADPPEGHVPGVNIQPLYPDGESRKDEDGRSDSSKATVKALKSALRQDPDVLGVGEIRDPDIAKLTFEASLTGHLVGSTLHASRAFDAYTRVIEYYGFNASMMCSPGMMQAIIAQQLLPRVCVHCCLTYEDVKRLGNLYEDIENVEAYIERTVSGVEYELNEQQKERLKKHRVPESLWYRDYTGFRFANIAIDNDCEHCRGRGINGRVLAYEIFVPSRHPEAEESIAQGNIHAAIKQWRNSKARHYNENMIDGITLDERAMKYAQEGVTCTYRTLDVLGGL